MGISLSLVWRDKTISGVDEDIDNPRLRRSSSSFFMPGKGNSLASLYLARSTDEAGGIGDTPLLGGVCNARDCTDADADGDCITD